MCRNESKTNALNLEIRILGGIMQVYLDNAATSFPKPDCVIEAVTYAMLHGQGNANRSVSNESMAIERLVYEARERLCHFFNFDAVDHVIFTKNITESINVVLQGYLNPEDVVVTTSIEHNAVMRPLEYLKKVKNISYTCIPLDETHQLDLEKLEKALKESPKMVIVSSGSNLTGDFFDLESIGKLCKKYNVPFVVDGAQRAGVLPIDMKKMHIDALLFTGHKSLLGPQGIGGFLIQPQLASQIRPFILGGTGSASESLEQPELMPDKFESGTGNAPGVLGLNAGLRFLMDQSDSLAIFNHKVSMIKRLQSGVEKLTGIRILGNPDPSKRLGVLAVDFLEQDNSEVAYWLNKQFGISTRVGLHCAPMAHETYGSYPQGAVRFSVSYATTKEEIDYTLEAIRSILEDKDGIYG